MADVLGSTTTEDLTASGPGTFSDWVEMLSTLAVNATHSDRRVHFAEPDLDKVPLFERIDASSNIGYIASLSGATKTTDMADGFGAYHAYGIQDDAGTMNLLAVAGAKRAGADNTGTFTIGAYLAGVLQADLLTLTAAGNLAIAGTLNVPGIARLGVEDTTRGDMILSGAGTGSSNGGRIAFELAADFHATIDEIRLYAYEDDLVMAPDTGAWYHFFRANGGVEFAGTLSLTGAATLASTVEVNGGNVYIDKSAGTASALHFRTENSNRWRVQRGTGAETGSNAGSDLEFHRYADDGSYLGAPLRLVRSTGGVIFASTLTATASTGNHAIGYGAACSGDLYCLAFGRSATASARGGIAIGYQCTASAQYAAALGGWNATASGEYAIALGWSPTASGAKSIAIGKATVSGDYSLGISLANTLYTTSQAGCMTIMGGYVGIGTVAPTCALDIVGALKVSSAITATGNITGAGVNCTSGGFSAGEAGISRGFIALVHGAGGNTPGYALLNNLDGTVVRYLFIDSSGRLRIHTAAPSADTDGVVVGTQT